MEFASLREHAIAAPPPRPHRNRVLIGAGAVVILLVIAAAVAIALTRPGARPAPTAAPAAPPSSVPVTSTPAPTPATFGRLQAQVPPGWHIVSQTGNRVDLYPDDGARERITVMQRQLTPGAGVDDVANTLDAQIKHRPAGQVSELRRNAVFGDRPGLSYEEFPGDGTTVRWQILIDSGVQASIGCQYTQGNWLPLAGTCEKFVHDLQIFR